MSREWKPGDVADCYLGRVFAVETEGGVRWVFDDGSGGVQAAEYDQMLKDLRPLVVVDPEDPEDIARLVAAWESVTHGETGDTPMTIGQLRMQAALRSLLAPPKPDEPQGLGAVVEDADGLLWVRDLQHDKTAAWLYSADTTSPRRCAWDRIPAVRVLSEGVVQ